MEENHYNFYLIIHPFVIINGVGGHHGRDGGHSGATTVGVSGTRRGVIHYSSILATSVWGGESRTTEDCQRFWRLDGQWSPTLGGLQGTDVGRFIVLDKCPGIISVGVGKT